VTQPPTLHLIGIFHTIHSLEYSHCAFTGKALRFSKMMQPYGYKVVEYANEGSESEASEKVAMLRKDELLGMIGDKQGGSKFYGDTAQIGSPWHKVFEERLLPALKARVQKRDIICHPFGHAHTAVVKEFPGNVHVETGIGYPALLDGAMKIFETYAWMHYHQGKAHRSGHNYEWVIPNYFDIDEWAPRHEHGDYIAFMGRICAAKGMDTLYEIAKRVNIKVKIAGQGDPLPWSHPNIEYVGVLHGRERSEFIRNAYCQLMPTEFVEPFGGAGVEGLLCGTPLIARNFGAFTETVRPGVNGYRCQVLKQWLGAINAVQKLDRRSIAAAARARYSLQTCGREYDAAFKQIDELHDEGWYTIPDPEKDVPIIPYRAPLGPAKQNFVADVGPKAG
jgi:glycosyltransferase involved in cell wall biosynthesis